MSEAIKPNVNRFIDACYQLGLNPKPILEEMDYSLSDLLSGQRTISTCDYLEFLNAMSDYYQRRFLAVELAELMDERDIGILIYMLRSASNIGMVIQLLSRFVSLVSPSAEVSLHETEDKQQYLLCYSYPGLPADLCAQDIEGTLAQFVMLFRQVLEQEQWQASHISFEHQAKSDTDQFSYPFAKVVSFGATCSGLYFDKQLLNYPVKSQDLKLLQILETSAVESLEAIVSDDLVAKVKAYIAASTDIAKLSVERLAKELGYSRRNLCRLLAQQGSSFSKLKEAELMRLACDSLLNSRASISLIAQSLGYSDSSAFNRAFKRVNHCTPSQFREGHR